MQVLFRRSVAIFMVFYVGWMDAANLLPCAHSPMVASARRGNVSAFQRVHERFHLRFEPWRMNGVIREYLRAGVARDDANPIRSKVQGRVIYTEYAFDGRFCCGVAECLFTVIGGSERETGASQEFDKTLN